MLRREILHDADGLAHVLDQHQRAAVFQHVGEVLAARELRPLLGQFRFDCREQLGRGGEKKHLAARAVLRLREQIGGDEIGACAVSSATTAISLGPGNWSMATAPTTCRLASTTKALPGPKIFCTRAMLSRAVGQRGDGLRAADLVNLRRAGRHAARRAASRSPAAAWSRRSRARRLPSPAARSSARWKRAARCRRAHRCRRAPADRISRRPSRPRDSCATNCAASAAWKNRGCSSARTRSPATTSAAGFGVRGGSSSVARDRSTLVPLFRVAAPARRRPRGARLAMISATAAARAGCRLGMPVQRRDAASRNCGWL